MNRNEQKIARLTQFPSDANGHGACRRTLQIREICEAAGFELHELRANSVTLPRWKLWAAGVPWKLRFGRRISHQSYGPGLAGYYHTFYTRALSAHDGARVVLWETTYDLLFPAVARGLGFKLIAFPHNLETLGLAACHQGEMSALLADEVDRLRQADAVFTISREEQWLLACLGLEADYLPYFPPIEAAQRLRRVRASRRTSPSLNLALVLGNALHPPTADGMRAALHDLGVALPAEWRIAVAGYGSEKLEINDSRVDRYGTLSPEQLETLLVQARVIVANQPRGAGALTRIPEALLAGVPVLANPIAARSTAELTGVHVYEDPGALRGLLAQDLFDPTGPSRAKRCDWPDASQVAQYRRTIAAKENVVSAPSTELAVIIPVFNRPDLLRYSLASVRSAVRDLAVEVIIVDDGSTDRPDAVIAEFSDLPIKAERQANAGSIPARLQGLRRATATYVQFLDSDDLVAPEKFQSQLSRLRTAGADLVYCDAASVTLDRPYAELRPVADSPFPVVSTVCDFCFKVQPNPHSAIYRRDLLMRALNAPLVPPERRFDAVGDAWLFYNLCVLSGRAEKVPGPWAIVGRHPGVRYSRHWEKLGVAAWHMMAEFDRRCPRTGATEIARRCFGESCFATWRALPRGFNSQIENSLLQMWRSSPAASMRVLGGRWFRAVSRVLGPERAARVFRRWQRPRYAQIASVTPEELQGFIGQSAPSTGAPHRP